MTDEQQKGINDTPVEDISDSKDEAEKSFLKELDDAEKNPQPAAVASPPTPSKGPSDEKPKSKFSSIMDSLNSKPSRKRDIDPILGVSLAVFILCSVVVLGNFAYGELTHDDNNAVVKSGDTVYVEYVGNYYILNDSSKVEDRYFDMNVASGHKKTGAVVFDNNFESIGKYLNDDSNIGEHSWAFTKKTSYSNLSFTVGGTTVLTKFGNATIGHKVGETVKVHIAAEDAYELTADKKGTLPTTNCTVDTIMVLETSVFTSLTGVSAPVVSEQKVVNFSEEPTHCPFGWSYTAMLDDTGKNVIVNNLAKADTTYDAYGQAGTIKVSTVENGKITFTYNAEPSSKFVKVPVLHNNVWTASYVYMDGTTKMYKTDEKAGVDLYFQIKIVEITSA